MAKPKKVDLADLARRQQRALALGKRHYGRADQLMDAIMLEAHPGDRIPLGEGNKVALVVDNFAQKTTVFKPCGVRRFELKVVEDVTKSSENQD